MGNKKANPSTGSNASLKDRAEQFLLQNYGERKMALVRGEGVRVWDAEGREYLDFISGLGVNNLGHCHPRVVEAIREQAGRLLHVSNLYLIEPQIELAELLTAHTFADRAYFCNSGAEAVESAMKLARRYASTVRENGKTQILTFRKSFHGRTFGGITATGQEKYQKGFAPLLPDIVYAELNDPDSVRAAFSDKTCAIMIEPVQGEGGINVAHPEFLQALRRLCDDNDALLLCDEVQCGFGRTGRFFAFEHAGIVPDAVSMAKGLGGGVAIGAMLCTEKVAPALSAGTHAATFGGNPLSTAAGCAAVQALLDEHLIERSADLGLYFKEKLEALRERHAIITDVRGLGLMLGVEVGDAAGAIYGRMMERGILTGTAMGNTVRFLPPLVVKQPEIDHVLGTFEEVLSEVGTAAVKSE